jgi:hypothetical protein
VSAGHNDKADHGKSRNGTTDAGTNAGTTNTDPADVKVRVSHMTVTQRHRLYTEYTRFSHKNLLSPAFS